jgi:putative membrane protein insertion efficiency factor
MLTVLFIRGNAYGKDLMKSPDVQMDKPVTEASILYNPLSTLFDLSVKFFQNFISPVDGDRCAMYPTCSAYSRQAIKKYGAIKGFVMTADRVIHEGDEQRFAPLIRKGGSLSYYDPPENNDFWHLK